MTAGEQIQKESYLLVSTGAECFSCFLSKALEYPDSRMGELLFQANFFFPIAAISVFSLSLSLLPGTPVLPIHSDVRGSESEGQKKEKQGGEGGTGG